MQLDLWQLGPRIRPQSDTFTGDDDISSEPSPATTSPTHPSGADNRPADPGEERKSGSASPQGLGKTAGTAPASPQELIQTGMSFLSGLAQTLSSPEKTQELVQSIAATDEQTGQTYLKIPVESAVVVENAVKLLGGLLAGFTPP